MFAGFNGFGCETWRATIRGVLGRQWAYGAPTAWDVPDTSDVVIYRPARRIRFVAVSN
jgi:hypothetical protein